MKKTVLFIFTLLFAVAVSAQNRAVLFQESFDNSGMPAGWSITGNGTTNWSVTASNKAGGEPNELHLAWSPQFNGLSRVLMGTIDLTGVSSAVLMFKHSLDNYSGSTSIGFSTSSDGGTTWNNAWSQNFSNSVTTSVMAEVSSPDFGQSNVMFSMFFNGSSYNINDWYFDDIQLFTLDNLDLGITTVNLTPTLGAGVTPLSFGVMNLGTQAVTAVRASYQVNDEEPVVEEFTGINIASLGTSTLTFSTPILFSPGSYVVTVRLETVNGVDDDNADNNLKEANVSCAFGEVAKIPMIEHFSSSTCGPCVSVNTTMNNFCNNNPGRFTYTKYQMNWPGSGDPYYTAEGGARRTYYGVSAVPQCFLDGEDQGYAAIGQGVFNQHAALPSFVDIQGGFTVDGNTISVSVDVMSYIDLNAKLFISVNEKETHGNVGSNGETTFHHVFMKMLTNTAGDALVMNALDTRTFEYSFDMSSTHVEEMSDLEVSVWVQNYGSKEIYNSHFLCEEFFPDPVMNLTLVEDEANATITAAWEAPADKTPVGYNVIVNNELVAEDTQDLSFVINAEIGQLYIVQVQAIYENAVSIHAVAVHTIYTTVDETPNTVCNVFPNPAAGEVFIQANENIKEVSIFNTLGMIVNTVNGNGMTQKLDVTELANGVYFIQMNTESGATATRRIVIAH